MRVGDLGEAGLLTPQRELGLGSWRKTRVILLSLSVEGGLGTDSLLSLQVKSSLHLIPDHLSLLKLCPPEAEEGRGGLPGRVPSAGLSEEASWSLHPCSPFFPEAHGKGMGEVTPAS